ncbi:MAG: hypothetical protein RIS47_913 [Bacteroidota bacterium]|jgi:RNA polymerase sigma-70 factor (ECF subfamily)
MKEEPYSDEQLIDGCVRNKRPFQAALYERYASKMYPICLNYCKEREAAQDVLQDAFMKIFDKIKDFKNQGNLEGWIRRIVVNTAIDSLRKVVRQQNFIQEEMKGKEEHAESFLSNFDINIIYDAIRILPEGAKLIFNLYALEGYSHKEIAERLEISEGTSKSQYSRAKMLLQNHLYEFRLK